MFAVAFEHLLGLVIVLELPLKKCAELPAERALEEERMAQFFVSFGVVRFLWRCCNLVESSRASRL